MPFDAAELKKVFSNKYALAGVAVAAGVGGFVLYKRKQSTGSSLSATGTNSAAGGTPTAYGTGFMNTTGSDTAQWLGTYSGNLQTQLDNYNKQLTDALAGLQSQNSGGTTGTTGVGAYPGTPKPTSTVAYVTKAGQGWSDVLNALGFAGSSDTLALEQWNRTHGATANGKHSNAAASDYLNFGVGTVLAVPNTSPGTL